MDIMALVSAVLALAGAALAAALGYWAQRRLRALDQHNYMAAYGASLAWAAYDLQNRLYNILYGIAVDQAPVPRNGFMTNFLTRGSEDNRRYARLSTAFVLAEYLGWVEILRRDVQFLNLGSSLTNRRIMGQIAEISSALNQSSSSDPEPLRLFRAQQRALGELMIHPEGEPGRQRCMGYAEFCVKLDTNDDFRSWFRELLTGIDSLAEHPDPAVQRMEKMQVGLISLIDLLDPKNEQFPKSREFFDRSRVMRSLSN